jgi:hypothetical protein
MMKKIFLSLSLEEDAIPDQPVDSLQPRIGRRPIELPKIAFLWFAFVKSLRGESVVNPERLASWMLVSRERDDQLVQALTAFLENEVERMRSLVKVTSAQTELPFNEVV